MTSAACMRSSRAACCVRERGRSKRSTGAKSTRREGARGGRGRNRKQAGSLLWISVPSGGNLPKQKGASQGQLTREARARWGWSTRHCAAQDC
eukprot:245319-Rhodomonas_salina.1